MGLWNCKQFSRQIRTYMLSHSVEKIYCSIVHACRPDFEIPVPIKVFTKVREGACTH